jgi:AbrB family looped-hinge helix DNA binding protein
MKRLVLKVDSKGRVQIPKEVRKKLGIRNEVSATVEDGSVTIEPVARVLDRLANEVRFNFKSVEESLPKLRRTAEDELLKQISQ